MDKMSELVGSILDLGGVSTVGRIAAAIGRARSSGGDLHDQAQAAIQAMYLWQPIETVPKDGKLAILAAAGIDNDDEAIVIGRSYNSK